jgi:hypothetical protein
MHDVIVRLNKVSGNHPVRMNPDPTATNRADSRVVRVEVGQSTG